MSTVEPKERLTVGACHRPPWTASGTGRRSSGFRVSRTPSRAMRRWWSRSLRDSFVASGDLAGQVPRRLGPCGGGGRRAGRRARRGSGEECGRARRGRNGSGASGLGRGAGRRRRKGGRRWMLRIAAARDALGKDGLLPEMRLFWRRRRGSASRVKGGRGRWSERRDLNPRPPVPQTGVLPGCATLRWGRPSRSSVLPSGIEDRPLHAPGWRRKDGGAEGGRTPDLRNAIAALSRLSYGPEPWRGQMRPVGPRKRTRGVVGRAGIEPATSTVSR